MKKYRKTILWLMGTAFLLGGVQNPVHAEELEENSVQNVETEGSDEYDSICDVTSEEFGADGTDENMDTAALQAALDRAKNNSGKTLVQIPDGTYYTDNILHIYSNTDLVLGENARIVRTDLEQPLLSSAHVNEDGKFCYGDMCEHGGYSQINHVSITGGIWDGNVTNQTNVSTASIISFAHGSDISMKDTTVKDGSGYHLLVLDGVSDARIKNVLFADQRAYTGTDNFDYFNGDSAEIFDQMDQFTEEDWQKVWRFKEALHIDFTNQEGSENAPYDDTVCNNIIVTGCRFEHVLGGVGDHHSLEKEKVHTNIEILNNNFSDLKGNVIDAFSMKDLSVSQNQISNADMFLYARNSVVKSAENAVSGVGMAVRGENQSSLTLSGDCYNIEKNGHVASYAMVLNGASQAEVNNCQFENGIMGGILAHEESTLDLIGSTVNQSGEKGGVIYKESHGSMKDSKVTDTVGEGVIVITSSNVEIRNNEIIGEKTGIHVMSASSEVSLCENQVSSQDTVLMFEKASGTIANNVITVMNEEKNGIRVKENTDPVTVSGNTVEGGYNGIYVGDANGINIFENTVSKSKNSGICISQSEQVEVKKNTVTDSKSTIDIGFWGCSDGNCTENTVTESETDNIKSDNLNVIMQDNKAKTPLNGWKFKNDAWYYYENGKGLTGWQEINGKRYHFKSNGKMSTGWRTEEKNWYYLKDTGEVCTGWFQEGKAWYYADEKGAIQTGWQTIGGKKYYLKNSGQMSTGWLLDGDNWYYLKSSGELSIGWYQIDKIWYYSNKEGILQTGWQTIGKNRYYFRPNGKMQTGWFSDGSSWYYLKKSGELATGWYQADGIWYYGDSEGVMQTGWQTIGKNRYYLKSNGKMQIGWLQDGNNWYYLKKSGEMSTGWYLVGNIWYYADGKGAMQTGWKKIGGSWYYFRENGKMQTGWLQIGTTWYYLIDSGKMLTGWQTIDGAKYYFDTDGKMCTGKRTIDGKEYVFASNGKLKA